MKKKKQKEVCNGHVTIARGTGGLGSSQRSYDHWGAWGEGGQEKRRGRGAGEEEEREEERGGPAGGEEERGAR